MQNAEEKYLSELTEEELAILRTMQKFAKSAHIDSSSHDYSHVLMVCKHAITIAKKIVEPVDPFVVIAAALLHDIGKTNNVFGHIHGLFGASLAEEFLSGVKVDIEKVELICRAIIRHTPTSMIPPESAEEMIVFDADCLDRLGLMGLLRGFIGKKGNMNHILTVYMKRRMHDYDKLNFQESKDIGDIKNTELEAFVAIVRDRLEHRMEDIHDILKNI